MSPQEIPAPIVETIKRLRSAIRHLSLEFGRDPTIEEVAEMLDVSTEEVREILRAIKTDESQVIPDP